MASAIVALLHGVPSPALNVVNPANLAPVNGQAFAVPGTSGVDVSWDIIAGGTALATFQADLQGSMDAAFTNPEQLDTTNVVGSFARSITGKQMPFMRIRIVTATGGDGTSTLVGRILTKKRGAEI
jgi:hypothetical protein